MTEIQKLMAAAIADLAGGLAESFNEDFEGCVVLERLESAERCILAAKTDYHENR